MRQHGRGDGTTPDPPGLKARSRTNGNQKGAVMTDTNAQPVTDGDITPPPAGTDFTPAAPLKDAGVDFAPEGGALSENGRTDQARQALKDGASKYTGQASDKIRQFADTGKEKATDALGQFSQLLTDAAAQVDEKLGAQYGDYARQAAGAVNGFSDQIRNKDVDALVEDARGYIRKSPAVAVGIAAALGFVVARLVQSGIDDNRA